MPLALALAACPPASTAPHVDGIDEARVPESLRADYAIFRARCSKCHSLDRPLGTAIEDESYWREYVERMRRQPGSGISRADGDAAVRFLLWYHRTYRKAAASAAVDAAGAGSTSR
jgi:mono/diheme cytochrome c family protein